MPTLAMGLTGVDASRTLATQDVLALRYRLKVSRVHAGTIAA